MDSISTAKAVATIDLLIRTIVSDLIPLDWLNAYDFDIAVGVQLDIFGQYIGLLRNAAEELSDDNLYREMLRFKIINNMSDNTLKAISEVLNTFFGTDIFIYDMQNMAISYVVKPAKQFEVTLAHRLNLLPKPQGVGIIGVFLYYADTFDLCTDINQPGINNEFSDYSTGFNGQHWMQYSDLIV
jgi:hypothetical protein